MKKILIFALALIATIAFVSCKKDKNNGSTDISETLDLSKEVDSSVWLTNFTDGKIAAYKENKKIILFFSIDDQDQLSEMLKNQLLNTDDFLAEATKKYVLVNLDLSNSLYMQTFVDENASEEEIATAMELRERLEERMRLATVYNIERTPTFYLLTKEGYTITELFFNTSHNSYEAFEAEIADNADVIDAFEAALAKTTEGSAADRVQAIDELYEIIDPRQTYVFAPLARQVLALDSKNKSGLVGKYVLAVADATAMDAVMNNDPQGMIDAFANAAENKYLSGDERQQAYYYAGHFLAGIGSNDFEKIHEYLKKSYDAAPESENAPQIAEYLAAVERAMAGTTSDTE